jgi:hypothetical protein
MNQPTFTALAVAAMAWLSTAAVANVKSEAIAHVDQLRAIKAGADPATIEKYNGQMDAAWQYFESHKQAALPILTAELSSEIGKAKPNDLVLLDIGYFVILNGDAKQKALARRALKKLDPDAEIVQWNREELFKFAHAAARDSDDGVLALIDRAFLKNDVSIFIPQHALKLDETLVCVFLYGAYGQNAEAHLGSFLSNLGLSHKVLETIGWIGSPASVDAVKGAMLASRDYDTFVRTTAYFMKAGGPQGRKAMLEIDPKQFDARTQEYYARIKPSVESASFEMFHQQLAQAGNGAKLSDEDARKRLSAMQAKGGWDWDVKPLDIVDSTLSKQFLIDQLTQIRAKAFQRLSDEALSDVELLNAVINTLRYRAK